MATIQKVEFVKHGPIISGMGGGDVEAKVLLDDGTITTAFRFYSDELAFTEEELVGKTIMQAVNLKLEKDVAYLRAP